MGKRTTYLGSSDSPPIIGVRSYGRTELDVWNEKLGLVPDTNEPSPMMAWGERLEPLILTAYTERTGRAVSRRRRRRLHPEYPFIGATLDADAGDRIVEVKFAPYGSGYGEPLDGPEGLPPYVRVQVQHQLVVTGYPIADVPVLVRGYDLRIFEVPADPAFGAELVEELREWWETYVVGKVPPPMPEDPEDADRWLRTRYASDDGGRVEAPADDLLRDLVYARLALREAEARDAAARVPLMTAMGPAAELWRGEVRLATYRSGQRRKVAWENVAGSYRAAITAALEKGKHGRNAAMTAIAELEKIDLDALRSIYTTTEPVRTFRPNLKAIAAATMDGTARARLELVADDPQVQED